MFALAPAQPGRGGGRGGERSPPPHSPLARTNNRVQAPRPSRVTARSPSVAPAPNVCPRPGAAGERGRERGRTIPAPPLPPREDEQPRAGTASVPSDGQVTERCPSTECLPSPRRSRGEGEGEGENDPRPPTPPSRGRTTACRHRVRPE